MYAGSISLFEESQRFLSVLFPCPILALWERAGEDTVSFCCCSRDLYLFLWCAVLEGMWKVKFGKRKFSFYLCFLWAPSNLEKLHLLLLDLSPTFLSIFPLVRVC